MTADGLLPGQAWAIAPGPLWQARLWTDGRAHVIGLALAGHPDYGPMYRDPSRENAASGNAVYRLLMAGDRPFWYDPSHRHPGWSRPRRWHADCRRAMRPANLHERMVIAAKRNAAQAGQGEG